MSNLELGVIKPEIFSYKENFPLESGKTLQGFELIYET